MRQLRWLKEAGWQRMFIAAFDAKVLRFWWRRFEPRSSYSRWEEGRNDMVSGRKQQPKIWQPTGGKCRFLPVATLLDGLASRVLHAFSVAKLLHS